MKKMRKISESYQQQQQPTKKGILCSTTHNHINQNDADERKVNKDINQCNKTAKPMGYQQNVTAQTTKQLSPCYSIA